MDHIKRALKTALILILAISWPESLLAQQGQLGPTSNVVLAGYGSTMYSLSDSDTFINNFSASVSPVLLYSMGEDVLFETELEFGISGQVTTTALEYAQIDYLGFENLQVIAGKFLLPFGIFGERLHPTWINKFPSSPVLYGHAHGGVVEDALLPVLSDAGILVRYNQRIADRWALNISGWVSQGPRLVTEEEAEGEHVDDHAHKQGSTGASKSTKELNVPLVGFGIAFNDNNENKMFGARIGLVNGPDFEIYASGFHAMYDPEDFLDIYGGNVAVELRRGDIELRGEGVLIRQELEVSEGFDFLNSKGYYLQAAKKFSNFEALVRWGHVLESTLQDQIAREEIQLLAIGLNYWVDSSIPIKVAYEIDFNHADRLMIQWAFGF